MRAASSTSLLVTPPSLCDQRVSRIPSAVRLRSGWWLSSSATLPIAPVRLSTASSPTSTSLTRVLSARLQPVSEDRAASIAASSSSSAMAGSLRRCVPGAYRGSGPRTPVRRPVSVRPRRAPRARVTGVTVVVVGAAILDGDRLLAARRNEPPALAGGWELPGGKVEPGEDDCSALVRECREELGVEIALGERVGDDWPMPGDHLLRVWIATV